MLAKYVLPKFLQKIKFVRLKMMCLRVSYKENMNIFLLHLASSLKKGTGSGVGSRSGSISQRVGFEDPDPYQNVTDPQQCLKVTTNDEVTLA